MNQLHGLNVSAVLTEIFRQEGISRKEVADRVGISPASVTSIASRLLDAKLIKEAERVTAGQGRPKVPLAVDHKSTLILGIHLGPRTTGVVLTGLNGAEIASVLVPHPGMAAEAAFDLIVAAADGLIAEHAADRPILGTGLATGGIVDSDLGIIIDNPGAGWKEVPALDLLGGRLPGPLFLDNNARAAAQSELLYGHGTVDNDFVLIVVSADLGAVLVDEGRIRSGAHQRAGYISHLRVTEDPVECDCGRTGCLKAVATDDAVVGFCRAAGLPVRQFDDVEALVDAGDSRAVAIVRERNRSVARAVADMLDLLDPALVVIAGTPAERPEMLAQIRDDACLVAQCGDAAAERIVFSSDHALSLSLFAASLVVSEVLRTPLLFMGETAVE
ncbi:ROK family transcriptional regulator [Zhihengliuella halotolerans]|uniref:ROK family transcriptional regulator n=1 Tax=Zhihengliuella halotolerans TaxID=370736 RepID=UPI00102CF287|nr:ROK family transcriptional regulator [Zhihengliuella halotolerans]